MALFLASGLLIEHGASERRLEASRQSRAGFWGIGSEVQRRLRRLSSAASFHPRC
jgi:hypothetical protein